MSPEQRQKLKSKVSEAGDSIKDTARNVESSISEKYDQLKTTTKGKVDDIKN